MFGIDLIFWSYPVLTFSGFAGGMGERYLSRDGNWDTRSKRSHIWRDISIYTTAFGSMLMGRGLFNDGRLWLGIVELIIAVAFYYIGTRVGYNFGQFTRSLKVKK